MENNPIRVENKLEGTLDWELNNPATNREIEGYGSLTSVSVNKNINLFVNTSSPKFSITIYRMGWYNGKGGRLIKKVENITGTKQSIPAPDTETGLIDCDWTNPTTLQIPLDWTTGVYVAKLEESKNQKQSYIIFTVKDNTKKSEILFQLPVTTYQAYNFWGGKSLYDWGSGAPKNWGTKTGARANKVSFNRPYACSNNKKAAYGAGAGEFFTNIQPVTTHFFPISSASWDFNMVRWLEKNEYNVSYITNIDTHESPENINNTKTFMSHGHDEYWSSQMRINVENALSNTINLAFFSSNTMFWQVRMEESKVTKDKNRILVCYKDALLDPIKDHNTTINFRDNPVNNPESKLIGVQHFMDPVDGDVIITKEDHWIFQGTTLKNGDKIKGLLGYEIDGTTDYSPKQIEVLTSSSTKNLIEDNYMYSLKTIFQKIENKFGCNFSIHNWFLPAIIFTIVSAITILALVIFSLLGTLATTLFSISTILVASLFFYFTKKQVSTINKTLSKKGTSNITIYSTKNNAKVFASGTMQWSWGLDDFNAPNLRSSRLNKDAQIITKNILDNFTKE
ncbi:N,N-dimethylformamidase beta subunit family domain-containing protein [Maribacter sp.]|uniref:N,N-dimethylformamidase beta subunit family domain-containing protein n=1 Tax=Maribacter sp. TaxID=1897614 RepID=UPI0025C49795|nr:N,N-dimethylformamidase beta subunit family domain-containing protein [Maribacter sp.]